MSINIKYPTGYGPDNSLPLDVSNSVLIEVPPGYVGNFGGGWGGDNPQWEQAICIYSMMSGAKVWEYGNYERHNDYNIFSVRNTSAERYVYLLTSWHKETPPNADSPWIQTGKPKTIYAMEKRLPNRVPIIIVEFKKYGELSEINTLRPEMRIELVKI